MFEFKRHEFLCTFCIVVGKTRQYYCSVFITCCVVWKNMLLLFSALVTVQLIGHVHVYALILAAALTAGYSLAICSGSECRYFSFPKEVKKATLFGHIINRFFLSLGTDLLKWLCILHVWHKTSLKRALIILLSCCFTSTEARWPIRDGERVGRGRQSEGLTAETVRKRPETPWTAAWTMEVLRLCPLAIAQRLVHCAIAVSTAVLDRVTKTMSVALLLTNNLDNSKQNMSNLLSPAPPP